MATGDPPAPRGAPRYGVQSGPRDAAAFEVRDALPQPGCVVCRLSLRSVSRVLESIAYEQVNDIAIRKELRRARGFCNEHAHQWLREARSVLGTALIYRDVLQAALSDLTSPAVEQGGGLLRALRGATRRRHHTTCPGCRAQLEAEARYVSVLAAVLASEPDLVEGSSGVCRRHAIAALRVGGPGANVLAERTRRAVEELVRELDEVIRKEDYRFRHEARTEIERTAPSRAIAWAAGAEGLTED